MKDSFFPEGPVLVFAVGDDRWAIPVQAVERVVHAVEISPSPAAPPVVVGVIDVSGTKVPVFDLSRPAGGREIALEDKFLLVQTRRRLAALWASEVFGVVYPKPDEVLPTGGLRTRDGVAFFQEPDGILSADEEAQLAAILGRP